MDETAGTATDFVFAQSLWVGDRIALSVPGDSEKLWYRVADIDRDSDPLIHLLLSRNGEHIVKKVSKHIVYMIDTSAETRRGEA